MNFCINTPRLTLREFNLGDAAFAVSLLNSEGWLRFIGDRNVRSAVDARLYLEQKIIKSYFTNGFGLYLVQRKSDGTPIGMCGLVKRDILEQPDLGFAFLPEFEGQGYAFEAAIATRDFALHHLCFKKLYAITLPSNERSLKLLQKLGMQHIDNISVDEKELQVLAIFL